MKRKKVDKALKGNGCAVLRDDGPHVTWVCGCKNEQHTADIPRHKETSPGVIRDTIERMTCLPKGWLQ
jgi:hypothetical protein